MHCDALTKMFFFSSLVTPRKPLMTAGMLSCISCWLSSYIFWGNATARLGFHDGERESSMSLSVPLVMDYVAYRPRRVRKAACGLRNQLERLLTSGNQFIEALGRVQRSPSRLLAWPRSGRYTQIMAGTASSIIISLMECPSYNNATIIHPSTHFRYPETGTVCCPLDIRWGERRPAVMQPAIEACQFSRHIRAHTSKSLVCLTFGCAVSFVHQEWKWR
ncbi:hypothetical protein F5Y15DRAFT_83745 [Xylariaceae sp. FL0016]|nr:hypothetical protein F5Y15DRAFT_83745 [Xylariaceae sp. FL0016]